MGPELQCTLKKQKIFQQPRLLLYGRSIGSGRSLGYLSKSCQLVTRRIQKSHLASKNRPESTAYKSYGPNNDEPASLRK